jgi:hypothetical protein
MEYPNLCPSIATVAAWRLNANQNIEIEIDNGLQGFGGSGVAETVRQGVVPGGVFGLQGEQPGDGVVPALQAGAPVGWPAVADDGCWLLDLFAARTVAGD